MYPAVSIPCFTSVLQTSLSWSVCVISGSNLTHWAIGTKPWWEHSPVASTIIEIPPYPGFGMFCSGIIVCVYRWNVMFMWLYSTFQSQSGNADTSSAWSVSINSESKSSSLQFAANTCSDSSEDGDVMDISYDSTVLNLSTVDQQPSDDEDQPSLAPSCLASQQPSLFSVNSKWTLPF